jgi:hypothetical protein
MSSGRAVMADWALTHPTYQPNSILTQIGSFTDMVKQEPIVILTINQSMRSGLADMADWTLTHLTYQPNRNHFVLYN